MAWSTVETKIANPAGSKRHMAKLSPKQIKYFGTARQKAALKARRRASAKKAHKPRSKPNPHKAAASKKKHATARKASAPLKKKRKNPVPQIIAWTAGNPAKRSNMPAKKRKKSASAKKNAGARHYTKKRKTTHHKHRRLNPGDMGRPIDWATGGAGVVLGGLGSRVIPQLVLGASNTGPLGYLANGITAVALGWISHMFFPKQRFLMYGVILGGMGGLITRIVTEQTPYGASLSTPAAGLGDWGLGLYRKSNYLTPQRIQGPSGPASSNFYWGDGSQPSYANGGMDGSGANC